MSAQKRSIAEDQKNKRQPQAVGQELSEQPVTSLLSGKALLLGDPRLAKPANVVQRAQLLRAGQRTLGNQAVQRMLREKLELDTAEKKHRKSVDHTIKAFKRAPESQVRRQARDVEGDGSRAAQTRSLPQPATAAARRKVRPEGDEEALVGDKLLTHRVTSALQQRGEREEVQTKLLSGALTAFGRNRFGRRAAGGRVLGAAYQAIPARTRSLMMSRESPYGPGRYGWSGVAAGAVPGRRPAVVRLTTSPDVVQRNNDKDKPAKPTLKVAPKGSITRGSNVTLTVGFKPKSGEKLEIKAWEFISDNYDTVTRDAAHAKKTTWQGKLVLPGEVSVDYEVTPTGKSPVAGVLQQKLQVTPRTGKMWEAAVTEQAPANFGGQPSPPQRYPQLGEHRGRVGSGGGTRLTIPSGPNEGFTYLKNLSTAAHTSKGYIHPDLKKTGSRFYRFHQSGNILMVEGDLGTKSVPPNEYSDFSMEGDGLTFNVPNWTDFYRRYGVYEVKATATVKGKEKTVTCQDSWWKLKEDKVDAPVVVANEKAVRAALGIGADEDYDFDPKKVGDVRGGNVITSDQLKHGTYRHEHEGAVHSHRANFKAIMRALDPERAFEAMVSTPDNPLDFGAEFETLKTEIETAGESHDLVDEAASKESGSFMAKSGVEMHDVTDDDAGTDLGAAWNLTLTGEDWMTN